MVDTRGRSMGVGLGMVGAWWTASWEWEGCFFRRVSGGLEDYFGKRSVEGRKVALVDGQLLENGRAALMDGEFRVRKLP